MGYARSDPDLGTMSQTIPDRGLDTDQHLDANFLNARRPASVSRPGLTRAITMNQLTFLIIPIMLLCSWALSIGFTNRRIEGVLVCERTIPLLARIKRHGLPHAVVTATTVAFVIAGLASAWWLLVTLGSFLVILAMPQKYVVTTSGIRTGRGSFRRWTEFAGVYRSKAGARLQTLSRGPDVPIWLSGDLGDDEFVHLLRTLVRDSYKGKLTSPPLLQAAEPMNTGLSEINGVAAFTQHAQGDIG